MEDLQRDLGRLKRLHAKSPPIEEAPKESWSLLLVGNRGRLLRLHLGWGVVLALGFCLLLAALGVGVWQFSRWDWRYEGGGAQRFQGELDALRRENQRLMARLAALEIILGETLPPAQEKTQAEDPVVEMSPGDGEGEIQEEKSENPLAPPAIVKPPKRPEVGIAAQKVALDGYAAGFREGEYRVSFNIRNLVNDTAVSGYIVSVLIPENPDQAAVASPSVAVQEGRPVEPQRGQFFSIRRFKDVRLRFGSLDPRQFQLNRIFVFNETGVLLHVEDFEVSTLP
jgi:hypothetical protein